LQNVRENDRIKFLDMSIPGPLLRIFVFISIFSFFPCHEIKQNAQIEEHATD